MIEQTPQTFNVTGMDCADCAKSIERGVSRLDGVSACEINFAAGKLKVAGHVNRDAVITRVRELGYDVAEDKSAQDASQTSNVLRHLPDGFLKFMLSRRDTVIALMALLLALPGVLFDELLPMLQLEHPAWTLMSIAAAFIGGVPIAIRAWRALRVNREISMDVLMTIGIVGALLIGATTEAGLVAALVGLSNALEAYTAERARDSLRSLMQLAPNTAVVLRPCMDCKEHLDQNGYAGGPCPFCGIEAHVVDVNDLRVGERVVVKPGERVPMDGRVIEGASALNQAPITGESMPVDKATGDDVFAGSINGHSALTIEVTRLAQDNTISRIIHMVEEAQSQRAPVQRFVDQFARVYTPIVIVIATLVAVLPPLLFNAQFLGVQGWLYRAMELIVAACPCALVISVPVALISAISNAARNGVLFKGGVHLESLSKVKAFAFDKTGTLTQGKPNVIEVKSIECYSNPHPHPLPHPSTRSGERGDCVPCENLLALAGAVEQRSEHPLAQAVVNASKAGGMLGKYAAAQDVRALAGRGVRGMVDGHEVFIGSHMHFDQSVPHDAGLCDEIERASQQGYTSMLVSVDGHYAGYITVADEVRNSSRDALAALKHEGVQHLVMLTGDSSATAQRIAHDVGVTDVRAGLLPEDKVEAVKQLRAQYGAVAMVGDGVNDAPALAASTVGIAMGAGGTAQALETADVALMADDLGKLPFALRLSKSAMRTIQFNIAFSVGIKLAFFVLVLLGMGSMWMAVAADMGATLFVTLNGMRLLRKQP
jgi:Cd2+/Zn2+-exporting ATPase